MNGLKAMVAAMALVGAPITAAATAEAGSSVPKATIATIARASSACPAGAVARPLAAADGAHPVPRFRRLRNRYGTRMFGIAPGGGIQMESRPALAADLGSYHEAGVRWLRVDINWASIQAAGPSSFAWTATDDVVRSAERCGMRVLGVIYYTPAWARPAGTAPVEAPPPAAYGQFAEQAAAHYRRLGVSDFEIWNEPNTAASFAPVANPGLYTAMLKAAYRGIKQANPRAAVITGGLAPSSTGDGDYSPVQFLEYMYESGAKGYFDDVGMHPYCWPAFPGARRAWSAWYEIYGTHPSIRSVMVAHGDGGKQVWGTEFGAPTYGPPGTFVGVATQAAMLTRAYELWSSYRWAGPLFTYSGRDTGDDATTDADWFGLISYTFEAKPSFGAYRALTQALGATVRAERRRLS